MLASTVEEDRKEDPAEVVPTKKRRKYSADSPSAEPSQSEGRIGKRRSARHSGEHENADPPTLQIKKKRKDRSPSAQKPDQDVEKSNGEYSRTEQDSRQDHIHPIEFKFDVTKIALPFADTPIIRRNKEMRKTNGSRRSSLGMRGRRASSLIDAGRSDGILYLSVILVLWLTSKQRYLTMKLIAPNFTSI